jgi:hypothetical protein
MHNSPRVDIVGLAKSREQVKLVDSKGYVRIEGLGLETRHRSCTSIYTLTCKLKPTQKQNKVRKLVKILIVTSLLPTLLHSAPHRSHRTLIQGQGADGEEGRPCD